MFPLYNSCRNEMFFKNSLSTQAYQTVEMPTMYNVKQINLYKRKPTTIYNTSDKTILSTIGIKFEMDEYSQFYRTHNTFGIYFIDTKSIKGKDNFGGN